MVVKILRLVVNNFVSNLLQLFNFLSALFSLTHASNAYKDLRCTQNLAIRFADRVNIFY